MTDSDGTQTEIPAPSELLEQAASRHKERFLREKALLSMGEYLEVVAEEPEQQARDSARYLRDCFLHFGVYQVERAYGAFNRFALFDCPFDDGRDQLIGHEAVQEEVFGLLTDFARHGRVNRMILLHGPNGSAKSRFISCMMRALESYSEEDEGAQYTFSWVFPTSTMERGSIGFGGGPGLESLETFAHLKESELDARLLNETRDHPLLLIPRDERVNMLQQLLGEDYHLPALLTDGELSPKARQIYEALLKAYQGDLHEVFKHVQVERLYLSRRYRRGLATVDPQMRVDAGVRQVTADRSLSSLPPSLHNLTLYEPMGDLVDANRGVLEFNDLLKRPVEAFKYLLSTCENGTARLDTMDLYLDTVFVASCNAEHLSAFKQIPDFSSFKARIELVNVPYLVDYPRESQIYWELLYSLNDELEIGPHVPDILGMWAVLCRLDRPAPVKDRSKDLQSFLAKMSPVHKAELYASAEVPSVLTRDLGNQLLGVLPELYVESTTSELYEGRFGPSPRELKGLVLSAARNCGGVLTGVSILEGLRELCEQKAVYPFLHMETDGEYHNPNRSVISTRNWYLELVEDELNRATGLVDTTATTEVLTNYIDHVVHFIRKEKRANPITGRSEDPDATLMREVEERLELKDVEPPKFREGVVHRIAAWRMDYPEDELQYEELFSDLIEQLNESFYEEHRKTADRIKENLFTYLVKEDHRLDEDEVTLSESILERLENDFSYSRNCATEVLAFLLRSRTRKSGS